MFVAGQPVNYVLGVFAAFVGALDASSGRGKVAGEGQANGGTVAEGDGLLYQSFAE